MPSAPHLQMIQAVIERMGRNSFLLKGWSVTLVAALIGLAADKSNGDFAIIAAAVSVVLGSLDAYYLAVERKYRDFYDRAIGDAGAPVPAWSLAADHLGLADLIDAMVSPTVLLLHGSAIACAVVVAASA
jgi:hypothetical protein